MRKKENLPTLMSYLVGAFSLIVLFLFAVLREQSGVLVFMWPNAIRCIPYVVIYLASEIWLFPRYVRTNRLKRYAVSSLLFVVAVAALWSFVFVPMLPAAQPELEHGAVAAERFVSKEDFASRVENWVRVDSLSSAQLADSCANYHIRGVRPPAPPKMAGESVPPAPPAHHHPFPIVLVASLAVFAFFSAIHLLSHAVQTDAERKEVERMRAEAELKQLRYQLNPHFLMNTLNNIHALIEIDGESAQEAVILLSKMMRYMISDTDKEKVELAKELEFLSYYFLLMRKRYIDTVDIEYIIPEEIPSVQIPPAILVNLAENCFKHGISYQKHSFVHFELKVEKEKICCRIVNSRFAENSTAPSGVGVDNIRKRLDILYPQHYVYQVNETENEYQVELKIPIV